MNNVLNELREFLKKHDATILRSANDEHNLVISIFTNHIPHEFEFEEEISAASIKHGWYEDIT